MLFGLLIARQMTTWLLGRLTHHCHIVEIDNESYRFRHSSNTAEARIRPRELTKTQDQEESNELIRDQTTIQPCRGLPPSASNPGQFSMSRGGQLPVSADRNGDQLFHLPQKFDTATFQ